MLYILLAGGVFNAVLVPQLVRAMKNDPDGGRRLHQPDHHARRAVPGRGDRGPGDRGAAADAAVPGRQRSSPPSWPPSASRSSTSPATACPQVFFYGMFVLVGQVLNARRSFGPMMWAPIANNVISVAVLGDYLLVVRPGARPLPRPAASTPRCSSGPGSMVGGYTSGQELLLGLGSTLGIAAQLLILLPFLKRAGFSYRPRFDFRGTGLGHTLRLGMWTVLFVVVNQVAYTVVVRIASSGTADAVASACGAGGEPRHRLHDLLQRVPAGDGAALDRDGLARDGDAAAARRLRGRRRPARRGPVSVALDAADDVRPDHPVRAAAARDRAGPVDGDDRLRRRPAERARLRDRTGAVRAGAGLLHHPLPDAARVLRPRAHPHGVLGAVRDRRDEHRARGRPHPRTSRRRAPPPAW